MAENSPDESKARWIAEQAHRGQVYGNGDYFTRHVLEVHRLVQGLGDDYRIVALLHDVVEDTTVTIEQIREEFGDVIASYVEVVTDPPGENRKARKAAANVKLATWAVASPVPLVVKAADRLVNVRQCGNTNNRSLLEMYRKEHGAFHAACFRPGIADDIWRELDALLGFVDPEEVMLKQVSNNAAHQLLKHQRNMRKIAKVVKVSLLLPVCRRHRLTFHGMAFYYLSEDIHALSGPEEAIKRGWHDVARLFPLLKLLRPWHAELDITAEEVKAGERDK